MSKKYLFLILLIIISLFLLINYENQNNIKFLAQDESGNPLSNVKIQIDGQIITTTEDGRTSYIYKSSMDKKELEFDVSLDGYEYRGENKINLENIPDEIVLKFSNKFIEFMIRAWDGENEQKRKELADVEIFINKKRAGNTDKLGELKINFAKSNLVNDWMNIEGTKDTYEMKKISPDPNSIREINRSNYIDIYIDIYFKKKQTNNGEKSGPVQKELPASVLITAFPNNATIYLYGDDIEYSSKSPFNEKVKRGFYKIIIVPEDKSAYEDYKPVDMIDLMTTENFKRKIDLPKKDEDWMKLAENVLTLQKYEEAIDYLSKVPKPLSRGQASKYKEAQYKMGQINFDSIKNYLEAIENFKNTIEYDPGNPFIYFNLGLSYFQTRQYEDAIKAFNEINALSVNIPTKSFDKLMSKTRFYRALIYEKKYSQDQSINSKLKARRFLQDYLDKFPIKLANTDMDKRNIIQSKMNKIINE